MTYPDLLRQHGGTIAFGFGLAFLSAFGQTFFISLFGPDIRDAFRLSNGGFGMIYSAATLASGFVMIWAGGVLDRVSTRAYAIAGLAGLGVATFGLSAASGVVALGLSLFALRLFGQGMLSHAAVTSTAKLSHAVRGRAVGIATLGFSAAEAVLPAIVIALIGALGWIGTWRVATTLLLATATILLITAALSHRKQDAGGTKAAKSATNNLGRREVLTDWRFLIFIPSMVAPAAIGTGYFFHQRLVAEMQGWPLEILALGVTVHGLTAVCATMTAGYLVDRFGATRLCRFHLLPLAGASLMLVGTGSAHEAPFFFALLGASAASNAVIVPAVLAELYGTERLGAIRALAASFMVAGAATTPGLFGFFFDTAVTPGVIGIGAAIYVLGSLVANVPLGGQGVRARPAAGQKTDLATSS